MSMYAFGDKFDARSISIGENEDGTVYVRQTSVGDLTHASFGMGQHTDTITFRPTEDYGIADVEDDIARRKEDFFISDVADSLKLWEVPYRRETRDEPFGGLAS